MLVPVNGSCLSDSFLFYLSYLTRNKHEEETRQNSEKWQIIKKYALSICDLPLSDSECCSAVKLLLEGVCAFTPMRKACFFSWDDEKGFHLSEKAGFKEEDSLEEVFLKKSLLEIGGSLAEPLYLPAVSLESGHLNFSAYFLPLKDSSHFYGVLGVSADHGDAFSEADRNKIQTLVSCAGSALYHNRVYQELKKELHSGVINALSGALEAKDGFTEGHCRSVLQLVDSLAQEMDFREKERHALCIAALFHDIGKLAVPDRILHKPGPLDEKEWSVMRMHPVVGSRILDHVATLKEAAVLVHHHHERHDGKGYPDGLRGDEIPLGARVIAAVDAYMAMTEDRVYRRAKTNQEAVAELKRCSGTQFDPQVVNVLLHVLKKYKTDVCLRG